MCKLIDPEATERSRRFHAERRERLWWVEFDELLESVLVDQDETVAWERTLFCDRFAYRKLKTDQPNVWQLVLTAPLTFMVVEECDMKLVMRAVRRNRIEGKYRKAGTEKEYRF